MADYAVNFAERVPPFPAVRVGPRLFWAAVLMAILAVATSAPARNYPSDAPLHHDIFNPVLALELPHSAADLRMVLAPPASQVSEAEIRSKFRLSTWLDFGFILSYVWFFGTAWTVIAGRPGVGVPMLIVLAGAADVVENLGILRAVATPATELTDGSAMAILLPSIVKWSLLSFVALLIGLGLARVELRPFRRPGTGILAIVLVVAALLGGTGLSPDIRSAPWLAGLFSHRHLETFLLLLSVFPAVVIAAGVYQWWTERARGPQAGGQVLPA